MEIISYIMAAFSLLGAIDLLFGNRFGLGREFERGIKFMGTLVLAMVGMLVLAPAIGHYLFPAIAGLTASLPIDPSSFVGVFLANDMGGAQLAGEFAKTEAGGLFNGLVVGSMLGATISFTLPYTMGVIKKERQGSLLLGLLAGISTVPVGCLVSALLMGLSVEEMLVNLLPILLISVVLVIGLLKAPDFCVKVFRAFGVFIKSLVLIGLSVGIFTYLTGITVIPYTLPLEDAMPTILTIAAVMSGAFPLIAILSRLLRRPLVLLGEKIGINTASMLGFLASLANNVTTFSMADEMDDRGLALNAAFAVSASFLLADHLAFTLAYEPLATLGVLLGKLTGGVTALLLAYFLFCRKKKEKKEE